MELRGKVAIVTGAGSGIGRAIALRLAEEGARVVASDVDLRSAEETATEIQEGRGETIALQVNVGSQTDVAAMVSRALEQWAQVDILVNNAGVSGEFPFLDMAEAEWDRVLNINLTGAFLCGQAAARAMVQGGRGGRIINIASVNAEVAGAGLAHYCASKGGLRMLTKVMALELAPHGINVNAVAPGIVNTPLTAKSLQEPAKRRALMAHVPLGRVGQPEDVAHAVLFLASEKASFITGTILFVDGGWLIE